MKKYVKWGGIVILIPISIFIILSILLYLPPIQNFVVEKVTQTASESTGMDIKIRRVSLSFPINLMVHETTVINEQDTVLDVDRLKIKVQLWPLLKKRVEVDGLELTDGKVNTGNLIEGMSLKGDLKSFYIESHGVELTPEMAVLNVLNLDDTNLDIVLADTAAADTTASSDTIPWKIKVEKVNFNNVNLSLAMPLDSISMKLSLGEALLRNGLVNLHESSYFLQNLSIADGGITYIANNKSKPDDGFDPAHIAISDLQIGVDSVFYGGNCIHANIQKFTLKERSGLRIVGSEGKLVADDMHISVPTLEIHTTDSYLKMNGMANWSISNIDENGKIKASFVADLSKKDLFKFVPSLPEDFKKDFPEAPLKFQVGVNGSLNQLELSNFDLEIPKHMCLNMQGLVEHALNDAKRNAYLEMKVDLPDMNFMKSYLGNVKIPPFLKIEGIAEMRKDTLSSQLALLTSTDGKLSVNGEYVMGTEAYQAKLAIDSLNFKAFMPKDSLQRLSANLDLSGAGLDFFSPLTSMSLKGNVDRLEYGSDYFSGIEIEAKLLQNKAEALLKMDDHHFDISTKINALLNAQQISANLFTDIKKLNLQALGVSATPASSSQQIHIKAKTNMAMNHSVRAEIKKNKFMVDGTKFVTEDVLLGLDMGADSIMSYINSGDLHFLARTGNGLDSLLYKIDAITRMISKQWENHAIDLPEIKKQLPNTQLRIAAGKKNPVNRFMESMSLGFNDFKLSLDTSPNNGLVTNAHMHQFHTDVLILDTIRFSSNQLEEKILLNAGFIANRNKHQEGFNIGITGEGSRQNAQVMVEYLNERNELGARIGVGANLHNDGLTLNLIPEHPTLVYRPFHVNTDNFLSINDKGRIQANVMLFDEQKSGMHLYSAPDSTVQNDLTLILNLIDIAEFKRIVPYMPDMAGLINAETHFVQPLEGVSMASVEAAIDSFKYNKENLGNWKLSAVYLPKENREHCIDGFITRNDEEIASLNGSYFTESEEGHDEKIDATLSLNHFPLGLTNAVVSRKLITMDGDLNGEMSVKGTTDKPRFDGSIALHKVNAFIPPASMNLRFDEQPIMVKNSKLDFNKYKIYTLGDSPFVINGDIDFSDFSNMMIDLQLITDDFELINGKKTKESLVYGKLYIDVATTIKGTTDDLKVRGAANILGKSDFTYIMKDSPLTVEDRLNDMVTFVNFNDTTQMPKKDTEELSLGGIDVLMSIHIDQAVQGRVDLNANGSNYMIVEGGGDLSFQYTPEGNMYMNGRYSLISGEMKYEMPLIPLKTFKIQEGSYIEWTGNMMNPNLNIKAYEKVRSSVSSDGKESRMVTFNVGVNLTNRLEDLGFTFTLEAPEDGAVQDELAAMTAAEKNKLAVTMLVTGLYIADSNASSGFNTNNVLNSFLQSQINDIAGSALKTIDVNFGMEKNDGENGGQGRTDYNFQFAKRFWNNRFRVVIGGKISTGNNAKQDESFIDNVSLEYRLDNSGTRYVKIFHDRKYANVLEGEIVETGAGIVLRKKVSRIGELFIFKKRKRRNAPQIEDKKIKVSQKNEKEPIEGR